MMYIVRLGVGEQQDDMWDYIVANHEKLNTPKVSLLYVTRRESSEDVSLVVDAKGDDALANLIFEVNKEKGLDTVSTVTLLKPIFFPVPPGTPKLNRYTVTIRCEADVCEGVYSKIGRIAPTEDNVITYLTCTFMDGGRSIMASILSKDEETLDRFLTDKIVPIEGVQGAEVTPILQTRKLASTHKWKKTVGDLTIWEFLSSTNFDDGYLRDIIAGA